MQLWTRSSAKLTTLFYTNNSIALGIPAATAPTAHHLTTEDIRN
jgi:hypothetical protein